jgi:hypothetical protein
MNSELARISFHYEKRKSQLQIQPIHHTLTIHKSLRDTIHSRVLHLPLQLRAILLARHSPNTSQTRQMWYYKQTCMVKPFLCQIHHIITTNNAHSHPISHKNHLGYRTTTDIISAAISAQHNWNFLGTNCPWKI